MVAAPQRNESLSRAREQAVFSDFRHGLLN
jgi:hypothetical protein